jgi:hypothetical protein
MGRIHPKQRLEEGRRGNNNIKTIKITLPFKPSYFAFSL